MAGVNIVYTKGRCLAELPRMILCYLEIEFTEEYLRTKEQLAKIRAEGRLLFQQIPLLEIDGKRIVQSGAISRYLARRGGLYGQTDDEATRIDELYEGLQDFVLPFRHYIFMKTEADSREDVKTAMARYLPVYDKILKETGSGYLLGNSVTLADLALLEVTLNIVECFGEEALQKDFQNVKKFHDNMLGMKTIAAFLNGAHRHQPNTPEYIEEVKTMHGMI